MLDIEGVQVENLRGYTSCALDLSGRRLVLVGRNNSGKTSLLKLLDWLVNRAPDSLLNGGQCPSEEEIEFLLPARLTQNRARRLNVFIRVLDGRSHRRYRCIKGVARLRLSLRKTPDWRLYLALGNPLRGESANSSDRAMELLRLLRKQHALIYVPSFRDGGSPRFGTTLLDAFRIRLSERALHSGQGGAPAEYRKTKRALTTVKDVAESLAVPLWEQMQSHLPPGMARDASIKLHADAHDLVEWLALHLRLRISTGSHDESTVPIADLGSGLQSLLDFAVQRSAVTDNGVGATLIFEEPEAFLHPSAQRTLARTLLSNEALGRVIVTTHSSAVVEEARYSDIVLCRDQRFFESAALEDTARDDINTALLVGHGAEMMFARSVLLVEGEGDRQFFEHLRRRLAALDDTGRVDELFVVPVGGKNSFSPWIRLLESYSFQGERPIRWLIAADGDAASQVRQAFNNASIPVSASVVQAVARVGSEMANGVHAWANAVRKLNRAARDGRVGFALLPVDLEHAALSEARPETLARIAEKISSPNAALNDLLCTLGSKAAGGSEGVKSPWIRGFIGQTLPADEMSSDVNIVLRRWLSGVMADSAAKKLLSEFRRTS